MSAFAAEMAEVGGQVLIAARTPARADYAGIVRFLVRQVTKLGVDVRLGAEATAELVLAREPEVVIVASPQSRATISVTSATTLTSASAASSC